jgi:hypothetical protein
MKRRCVVDEWNIAWPADETDGGEANFAGATA